MKLRIGHGFDTHRLEAVDGMHLGGVFIPCAYRVIAHSDGDVLIYALCDALLGALAADLGIDADAVSVKATTNEGLDAIGRCEGLSAHAVVLLQSA